MEENKIDVYQIIGFLLLIAAIFWWFNVTIPDLEKSANAENQTNAQENQSEIIIEKDVLDISDISIASNNETSNTIGLKNNQEISVENKDVVFKFNSKGGSLTQVQLKGYSNYKQEPLFIVNVFGIYEFEIRCIKIVRNFFEAPKVQCNEVSVFVYQKVSWMWVGMEDGMLEKHCKENLVNINYQLLSVYALFI